MAPRIRSSITALEALRKDNYANWSVSMKHYLLAHSLWDIVETAMEPPKAEDVGKYEAWTEKNASALNAIGFSCELDIFSQIRKINSAKVVWDTLAKMYAQPSQGVLNSVVELRNSSSNILVTKEDKPSEAAAANQTVDRNSSNMSVTKEPSEAAGANHTVDRNASNNPGGCLRSSLSLPVNTLAKMYAQPSQGGLNFVVELRNSSSDISVTKEDKPSEAAAAYQTVDRNSSNMSVTKEPSETAAAHHTVDRNSSNNPGRGDEKNHDYVRYAALLNHVRSGDLNALKDFLRLHPQATSAKITFIDQTALHIAVLAGHERIVQELVERMSDDNLAIQDIDGYTALARATTTGNYRMVECMIKKNQKLVSIAESSWGSIPVVISMNFDYKELAHYLYSLTPQQDLEPEKGHHGASLVSFAIYTLTLDIAVDLIRRCPRLAFTLDREQFSPLYVLASTSEAFPSGKHLVFWKRWVYSCIHIRPASRATHEIRVNIQNIQEETITTSTRTLLHHLAANLLFGFKKLSEMKLIHIQSHDLLSRMCEPISTLNEEARSNGGVYAAIFRAIKEGNFEFVYEIVRANPDLLYVIEYPAKRTIFMLALLHRQAKIFSLIYGLPQRKTALSGFDTIYNNTLHMAGIFTASTPIHHIPGAALQMQRELQWFKEVESLVPPMLKKGLNNDGLTPRQLFTRDHEDLMKKGEEWIKSTATSCTVVGALIATIMFAAAFTVPGGNNQNTGLPMFIDKKLFIIFAIFDSLSLFSSSASVLMFLGILTSRYAEEDFLKPLPKKMIIGLFSLFFSIATMMVAFSATLLLMLHGKSFIFIPLFCLVSVPVNLFVLMQFPLLVDMTMSTYGPGIFNKKMKGWI
ncbi:hypothetical protein CJ030_MR3G015852 [Morella rubra]|uniref:PGG domain-containing protein n=1 Tax=Morella rubra TaxID=262757 RepID=A0A6A1W5Q3_9ROSI|nr:hypothetical protein CJ030_MR3G015852 [Morella rubra]